MFKRRKRLQATREINRGQLLKLQEIFDASLNAPRFEDEIEGERREVWTDEARAEYFRTHPRPKRGGP